ncbi:sensor histidine kinase [Actinokineospora alba]|uniref:sensor histidine kinase n=1 Tax=Actinokineospora alba TaxID=504798 RepID=UPI001E6203A9|nr:histidine kinase [Actinokineospora alba]
MRTPLERMRKYTVWTLVGAAGIIGLLLTAEVQFRSPWLLVCVAVVVPQYVRISAIAMPGLGIPVARPWEIPATAVVALVGWWASLMTLPLGFGWAILPASILAAVAACHTGGTRWAITVLGSAFIGVSGLAAAEAADTMTTEALPWTLAVAVISVVFVLSNLLQVWLWSVIRQLDDARALAADLAVAEERLRFAAELHDVQGHHLQAIALKGELAERLIGHDDAAARVQAAAVSELARQALRETRGVVHGYRRTSLSTEIGNAVDILRAAGIAAAVDGDATAVPPALQPLFGALVREGTTNILRHTAAGVCDLVVSVADGRARVRLSNDGVRPSTGDPGSGIDSLRERFAAIGGQLRTEAGDGRFALVGEAAVG